MRNQISDKYALFVPVQLAMLYSRHPRVGLKRVKIVLK